MCASCSHIPCTSNNYAPDGSSISFHINATLIPSTAFSFKGTFNCLDYSL